MSLRVGPGPRAPVPSRGTAGCYELLGEEVPLFFFSGVVTAALVPVNDLLAILV